MNSQNLDECGNHMNPFFKKTTPPKRNIYKQLFFIGMFTHILDRVYEWWARISVVHGFQFAQQKSIHSCRGNWESIGWIPQNYWTLPGVHHLRIICNYQVYISINHNWLVVWIMNGLFFHFIYGMSSFPLTNSYFSRWLLHHQPDEQPI